MPRLADSTSRPLFEKLVSTAAWLEIDATTIKEHADEVFRFFPAVKQLTQILMSKSAIDEMVALSLYTLDVYRAIIGAGTSFVAGLPNDNSRQTRLHGLDTIRLGAAIGICSLLYLAMDASETYRASVVTKLTDAASYSYHSREGLQMIIATLDERLLPSVRPNLEKPYRAIREVVSQEYGKRSETASATHTTYQGLGPPNLDITKVGTVVSTTGGFSVGSVPAASAKRVEIKQRDGTTSVQHWIEWQDGETKFESVCFDGKPESDLVAGFQGVGGFVAQESQYPGKWFTVNADGREGRVRILTIAGRACLASVEGPSGKVSGARADAFLLSLHSVP